MQQAEDCYLMHGLSSPLSAYLDMPPNQLLESIGIPAVTHDNGFQDSHYDIGKHEEDEDEPYRNVTSWQQLLLAGIAYFRGLLSYHHMYAVPWEEVNHTLKDSLTQQFIKLLHIGVLPLDGTYYELKSTPIAGNPKICYETEYRSHSTTVMRPCQAEFVWQKLKDRKDIYMLIYYSDQKNVRVVQHCNKLLTDWLKVHKERSLLDIERMRIIDTATGMPLGLAQSEKIFNADKNRKYLLKRRSLDTLPGQFYWTAGAFHPRDELTQGDGFNVFVHGLCEQGDRFSFSLAELAYVTIIKKDYGTNESAMQILTSVFTPTK